VTGVCLKKDWSERLEEKKKKADGTAAGRLIYTDVRIYRYDLV
jgi:hypothetical protein